MTLFFCQAICFSLITELAFDCSHVRLLFLQLFNCLLSLLIYTLCWTLRRFCAICINSNNAIIKSYYLPLSHCIHSTYLACIWKGKLGEWFRVTRSGSKLPDQTLMFIQILTVHDGKANVPCLFGLKQTCIYLLCSTHSHLAWTKSEQP